MTNYEYANKMQQLCIKISELCKLHGNTGLHDFYSAAGDGFADMRNNYSPKEAAKVINKDQEDQLQATADYVKELEENISH